MAAVGEGTCRYCGASFRHSPVKTGPAPRTCGGLHCRALEDWTPDDWECRAHIALRRRDAGVGLTETDREALRRFPNPRGWAS
jgi:hypothetical protein